MPDRKANTDCERRRASGRCVSLTPGRSVEGAATGMSVPEKYSCRPGPRDVPLRNWDICPCQPPSPPNKDPSAAVFSRWCVMKVARSSTLEGPEVESGIATGDSYGELVSVVVRSRRTESGANGSPGSGSGYRGEYGNGGGGLRLIRCAPASWYGSEDIKPKKQNSVSNTREVVPQPMRRDGGSRAAFHSREPELVEVSCRMREKR